MSLTLSHAVLYVRDETLMVDFYTRVLGFQVTDRGPLAPNGPDVIFMSQDPEEHHQLGMVAVKQNDEPSNSVNHIAFRVDGFEDLQRFRRVLEPIEGIKLSPLSHGNSLSIYFNDPEGNGLEFFWDTPWHVKQPMARPWDPSKDEKQALLWVESEFCDDPGFAPIEQYREQRRAEFTDGTVS